MKLISTPFNMKVNRSSKCVANKNVFKHSSNLCKQKKFKPTTSKSFKRDKDKLKLSIISDLVKDKNLFITESKRNNKENNSLNKKSKTSKDLGLSVNTTLDSSNRSPKTIDSNKKINTKQSKLDASKVARNVTNLLKLSSDKSGKSELLDLAEPVFLQVECVKIPICPTKQLRFKLPHPLINDLTDVLLITADKKGSKIYPEKAIEYYEEQLAQKNIDFIRKVMPLRMLKHEYSQFEMRKKLVDQFDVILADANIHKMLSRALGKFALYKRKMAIPVKLDHKNLKGHLLLAASKTQMTVKSNGHCSIVQVGHTKMSAVEITANIIEVCNHLAAVYPGRWENIRSLKLKTSTSFAIPIYISLISPNLVKIPVEQKVNPEPVIGELSTRPGYNVVILPDANVILKKVEEEKLVDDSHDDEIIAEAAKYRESSKTVRYDESDSDDNNKAEEDSDKEADAVTEAMERQLLDNYEKTKAKQAGSEEDEEEEEEDEGESSDGESNILPLISGKKRKKGSAKKQSEGQSPKKKLKKGQEPAKIKKANQKSSKEVQGESSRSGVQKRGSRGGKKNKANKGQRKAMIKRKKAGKK